MKHNKGHPHWTGSPKSAAHRKILGSGSEEHRSQAQSTEERRSLGWGLGFWGIRQ